MADHETRVAEARAWLDTLCHEIPNRCVGSPGNRAATDFCAVHLAEAGFTVEQPGFDCMDWHESGAELTVGGEAFSVQVSPYSLGCRLQAPLVAAATPAELEARAARDQILLLHGELAREQIMPKNFPFYNPDHHRALVALLEARSPAALVTATGRNEEMVGALYPFPLFEDGDLDIPSVYTTQETGARLAARVGQMGQLIARAQRQPAQGCNVVARTGQSRRQRVVIFAHVDAKAGTPGALDNAGGVVVLLLLARLLQGYSGRLGVELVAVNGEDYYSAPGERLYVAANGERFEEILLGVNVDGAGYVHGQTAYSLYGCDDRLSRLIGQALGHDPDLVPGEPWMQGDHGIFLMHRRPALAFTTTALTRMMTEVVHTPHDTPDLVDAAQLVAVAAGLARLVQALDHATPAPG